MVQIAKRPLVVASPDKTALVTSSTFFNEGLSNVGLRPVTHLVRTLCRPNRQLLPRFCAATRRPLHKTHGSRQRPLRPSHSGIGLPPVPDPTSFSTEVATPVTIAQASADVPARNRLTCASGALAAVGAGRPCIVAASGGTAKILPLPSSLLVPRPFDLTRPTETWT